MKRQTAFKLAAYLLDMAADTYGNHGCNDFDLNDVGLTKEEQIEVVTYMNKANRSPEQTAEDIEHLPNTYDFGLMNACAAWFQEHGR